MTLGEDIRQARERLQMTQPELAEAIGVSESTVSNWERGKSNPKNRLALVRQVLRMDNTPHTDIQPSGRLLDEATMPELLLRVMALHEDAVRRAREPASPEPIGP